jgi:serine/threonine protein kinase
VCGDDREPDGAPEQASRIIRDGLAIAAGTRLGVYEVTAQIGVGGMGEVYRATDTRLKREVAVKVLPSALATDPDRLARFQREAELLASLNHPNIAAIYGLEEGPAEAGHYVRALVMELVEGPTLAERIAQAVVLNAQGSKPKAQSREPSAGLPID